MRIAYLLIVFIFVSCVKDLELPSEKSDQTIVVNCLFSEDSNWKVSLSQIRSFADQSESFVDNAHVFIIPENKDTIRLTHQKDGIYTIDEKPTSGVQYHLVIDAGKSGKITATSLSPVKPVISDIKPSTQNTIYFSNANLSDYFVLPLSLRISGNDQSNFVRFRLFTFNTEWGYKRYLVTKETITELRAKKFPEEYLSELEELIGVSMNFSQQWRIIHEISKKYELPYNGENIGISKMKEIKVKTRYEDSFQSGFLFSNSNWLSNVSKDIFNVFGEYSGTQEATLFVSYIPVLNKNDQSGYKEEYWLETVGMSEAYYKYQKSYTKQVVNQQNPFASVVEVYTNIENGVGIFAGYNRQMVHFKDY
jgi:hypothetical protein